MGPICCLSPQCGSCLPKKLGDPNTSPAVALAPQGLCPCPCVTLSLCVQSHVPCGPMSLSLLCPCPPHLPVPGMFMSLSLCVLVHHISMSLSLACLCPCPCCVPDRHVSVPMSLECLSLSLLCPCPSCPCLSVVSPCPQGVPFWYGLVLVHGMSMTLACPFPCPVPCPINPHVPGLSLPCPAGAGWTLGGAGWGVQEVPVENLPLHQRPRPGGATLTDHSH